MNGDIGYSSLHPLFIVNQGNDCPLIRTVALVLWYNKLTFLQMSTAVDTADAKIKVPSVENLELSKVLPNLDNIALHALPTAGRFLL